MRKINKICHKNIPRISIVLIFFISATISNAQEKFISSNNLKTEVSGSVVTGNQSEDFNDDEFGEFNENEFESFDKDEFGEFDESEFKYSESASTGNHNNGERRYSGENRSKNLYWILGILGFTILAGIFVRYKQTRNLRGFFLIAAVVILGFYRGACPCPISSLQNLILGTAGVAINWRSTLWFAGLIPITYLFGRVYCGWICHLGALQEFIYLPAKIKIFQSSKAQKVMRGIRIFFLIALIVQLIITKTNIFKHYDPFKVAFNLIGGNTLSWILLGLLLISSVFIYRPFCKTVCPVGLILGWISKIPGASVIGNNGQCTGCKTCDTKCKIRAITRDEKFSKLDNQECIGCGDCISSCKNNALGFFRNNKKNHHDKITCQT